MPKLSLIRMLLRGEARARVKLVYPWELPTVMRKHIVTGAMGTVHFVLLSGIYLVAFGTAIGLQHWQWGVLSGASSFTLMLQLVSAFWVRRTGHRRAIWFAAALLARLLRGGAIVAAYLLLGTSHTASHLAFMGMLVVSNCFDALATPPWLSWLADIIPERQHGRFMGRRSAWIAFANACVVFPIGLLVDRVGESAKVPALLAVFGFGFVVGMLDLFIHRTIPEPRMRRQPRRSFWRELQAPLADREFRPWLVFNGFWTFAMTLGGALATVYFIQGLGIRRNLLGGSVVLILVPLLGTVVAGSWIGRQVDRIGVKPILLWGHRFWAVLPLFWMLATPGTALAWLAVSAAIGSMSSGAAITAATKLITRLRPPEHLPMYVAASACVGCLTGGLGGLAAGGVLHAVGDATWQVGPVTAGGFHLIFAASLVLRYAATFALRRVPDIDAARRP